MLVFDIVVATLGASYLGGKIPFFSGKSWKTILSDLLFLEGAAIFTVGAFAEYAISGKRYRSEKHEAEGMTTSGEETRQKRISFTMLIMILGAGLIGLSMAIGILPV